MLKVTPTGRHAVNYDEESWKPTPEEPQKTKKETVEEFNRSSDIRQSTTKRMKNYLKKCKHALGKSSSSSSGSSQNHDGASSSWYVEKEDLETTEYLNETPYELEATKDLSVKSQDLPETVGDSSENLEQKSLLTDSDSHNLSMSANIEINEGEVQEIEDVFEEALCFENVEEFREQLASAIETKKPAEYCEEGKLKEPDLESIKSSPLLTLEQKKVDDGGVVQLSENIEGIVGSDAVELDKYECEDEESLDAYGECSNYIDGTEDARSLIEVR